MAADKRILITVVWVEKNKKKVFDFDPVEKPTFKDLTIKVGTALMLVAGDLEPFFDMSCPLSKFNGKTFIAIYWCRMSLNHHPAVASIQSNVLAEHSNNQKKKVAARVEQLLNDFIGGPSSDE